MHYIGVQKEKKWNLKKKAQRAFSIFIFIYTVDLAALKMYTNLKTLTPKEAEKSVSQNFHWRERTNEQIKGMTNNMLLFLLHNTTRPYQALYQISES